MADKYYIEGVDANSDPCSDKPEPTQLTFTYDRGAAARYAIAHAYRNSYPFSLTGVNYPGWYGTDQQFRVTNRISPCDQAAPNCPDNTTSYILGAAGRSFIFIPYIDLIPFADFMYADVTGLVAEDGTEATGSAVFPSQAVWMGGLPWTYDVDKGTACAGSNDYSTTGWRFCPEEFNESTYPDILGYSSWGWDNHTALTRYYSKKNNQALNSVLGDQRGEEVAIFDLYDSANTDEKTRINFSAGPLCQVVEVDPVCDAQARDMGFPNLDEPTIQAQFYTNFIANAAFLDNVNNENNGGGQRDLGGYPEGEHPSGDMIGTIKTGDYVTVRSGDGHGFFIAGWGPILSCPTALADQKSWLLNDSTYNEYSIQAGLNLSPQPLYSTNAEAQLSYPYSVPYVVDFPGSVDEGGLLQRPKPRPFYCAAYPDDNHSRPGGFDMSYSSGFLRFYTFPDSVALAVGQLYMPPQDFEWGP